MASCCLNNCLIIPPITPLFCTIFPLSQHTPLPIQVTGIETANHIQQEEGIVKTQNRERQRKRKQRWGSENRSDTVMLTAAPVNIWDTITQFHPHKKEILNVVWMLNNIGVNRNMIAATLGLQRWKTFYGGCEWTGTDVKNILEGYRT
jgi:hypothetical protein